MCSIHTICTLDLIHRIYFSNYSITPIFSLAEDSEEDTKYIKPPPTINGKITGNINIISQTMPGKQKSLEPLRHFNTPYSFYKHRL